MNSRTPSHNPFLAPQGKVAELITRARQQQRLVRRVKPLLDEALLEHCQVAGIQSQVLVLIAESPAWANRIRFQGPGIQRDLAAAGVPIQSIEVRVRPPGAPPAEEKPTPVKRLSSRSARCIEALASEYADSPLGAALHRLARHRHASDTGEDA